jgi:hypothetical protein
MEKQKREVIVIPEKKKTKKKMKMKNRVNNIFFPRGDKKQTFPRKRK